MGDAATPDTRFALANGSTDNDRMQGSIWFVSILTPTQKGTNMKIGIVGAGNIGSALTHLFRAA
ncbi:hypothetical protein EN943_37285, partial [Mesorhizobium sp. M7A.F.Ca.US.006.01.1.1]|uniref:hypothetical protein n=1 Tax=Mesorhizobium sp. M7A.F.Ca.US.006.01.1.1 TaxID=2496707 RepID=UPI000FD2226F